ncbi:MAG: cysteine hydrolase [Actinobacteria bacterium]|nr:cysteine hydrolase [Actinomycetota bacterium]
MSSPAATAGQLGPSAVAVAGSRPYAWPYDGRLTATGFALVVVTGAVGDDLPPASAIDRIAELGERVRACGSTVVWVACDGTPPPLAAVAGDLTVTSPTANGFLGSELDLVLRTAGIDRFALAGWPLEVAVHSTLRRANDLGYECLLLEDACDPLDAGLHESSISQILMSGGIFGAVATSSALLDALESLNRPADSAGQGA